MDELIIEAVPFDGRDGKGYYDLTISKATVNNRNYIKFCTGILEISYTYEIEGDIDFGNTPDEVYDLFDYANVDYVISEFCRLFGVKLIGGGEDSPYEMIETLSIDEEGEINEKRQWSNDFCDLLVKMISPKMTHRLVSLGGMTKSNWCTPVELSFESKEEKGGRDLEICILVRTDGVDYSSKVINTNREFGAVNISITMTDIIWDSKQPLPGSKHGYFKSELKFVKDLGGMSVKKPLVETAELVFNTLNSAYTRMVNHLMISPENISGTLSPE